ncbi:MAG TPA: DUF881 domain-containing protein [Natronosporangium sp.]
MTERRRYPGDFLSELFANPLDPGYADAAARRARDGPPSPWRRRAAAALRTVALVVIGFLFAVAYREAVATEPARTRAHAGLVEEVKSAQARTDELQLRSDELRRQIRMQQRAALGGETEELARIREQEAVTGLAAVRGPGVVVRLADAPVTTDPTTGQPIQSDASRVLDVDIQSVVNGLWASGAEAIAINGQRLTSTSTIRAAGDAILVDFRPVTSPYEVSAIGPADLGERFSRTAAAAAMRALVEQYGLGFSADEQESLLLPAASGPVLRYAHPTGASPQATTTGGR